MKTYKKLTLFMFAVLSSAFFYSCNSDNPVLSNDEYTISGQITGNNNFPLRNVIVQIGEKSFKTGFDGKFNIHSVKYPFDLIVKDSADNYTELYKSISYNKLYLNLPFNSNDTYQSNIVVNYTDSNYTYSRKLVFYDDNYGIYIVSELFGLSQSQFPVTLPYNVILNVKASIVAYDNNSGYKYFAEKSGIGISGNPDSVKITYLISDFTQLSTQTIIGTLSAPPYVFIGACYINLSCLRVQSFLFKDKAVAENLAAVVPVGIPVSFLNQLYFYENHNNNIIDYYYVIQGSSSLAVNCPDVFDILSPQDNIVNVDSNTVFSVTPSTNNIFRLKIIDSVSNSTFAYCTSVKNIAVKDLSRILPALSSNRTYKYEIEKTGIGYASVGEFLFNGRNPNHFSGKVINRHFTAK